MLAVCAALLVASCATTVKGTAVSVFDDPFKVAGMPAVDGPTGLRPGAKDPSREVEHSDGGEIDNLGAASVSDIEDFWEAVYGETFDDDDFIPVKQLISWDAAGYDSVEFCGQDTYGLENAGYCLPERTIGWDRGQLLPDIKGNFGEIAVTNVLAHEYGHAIQHQARLNAKDTPTLVAEQQADCYAGSYMRWVAEGNSDRFTLSTGDGLNNLLAAVISFRDPVLNEDVYAPDAKKHGSAFERITAFQFGFIDGAAILRGDRREGDRAAPRRPTGRAAAAGPDRRLAGQRGVDQRDRRRARAAVLSGRPADAAPRSGLERGLPGCAPEPTGLLLSGHQHDRRRHAGAGGDGHAVGSGRESRTAAWCPGTTPRIPFSSRATCLRFSMNAVAWSWTTPRRRCAPRALRVLPPRR